MVKENMKIKDDITIDDKISAIERIVDYFFIGGEYTPYYSEVGEAVAIAENFIEGVEFEDFDDKYKLALEDIGLNMLIKKFYKQSNSLEDDSHYVQTMNYVMSCVFEKVKFQKDMMIARSSLGAIEAKLLNILENENQRLLKEISSVDLVTDFIKTMQPLTEALNTEDQQELLKKLSDFKFDPESIASAYSKELFDSKLHQEKEKAVSELIEEKKKIKEREKELEELQIAYAQEQQKDNVKNVINYDTALKKKK